MKIKVQVHERDRAFLYHLAQEDAGSSEFSDYFSTLAHTEMMLHPHFRFCTNSDCCSDVNPTVSTEPRKYVCNPFFCTKSTTQPTEYCPECGEKTMTLEEYLDRSDCCTKWAAHMRARLAVARQFPQRKPHEDFGKEPAPLIHLLSTPAPTRPSNSAAQAYEGRSA